MNRKNSLLLAALVALVLSALLAATASATFEATMSSRGAGAGKAKASFIVEAGGGRRTRVRQVKIEGGKCGSIFIALIDAGKTSGGFNNGNGSAVFNKAGTGLNVRLELRVKPRGEGLTGSGLFTATGTTCTERVPLDLVSTKIRGGGRHRQD